VFNTFPQPQVVNPQTGAPVAFPGQQPMNGAFPPQPGAAQQPPVTQTPVNSAVPTAPYGGVAVPGMIAPLPPQPGQAQPGQIQPPQQPGQPIRRPGGVQ